jgi:hypothetical protein
MGMQGDFGNVACAVQGSWAVRRKRTAGDVDGWRSDLCAGDGGVPDPRCGGDRGRGGHGRSDDELGVPWVNVGEVRRSDGRGGEVDVAEYLGRLPHVCRIRRRPRRGLSWRTA